MELLDTLPMLDTGLKFYAVPSQPTSVTFKVTNCEILS